MILLLLGANGQLGQELQRALAPLGTVVATTRSGRLPDGRACEAADLNAPTALTALLGRVMPDVVINAAAYTAVDRAEQDRDAAWRINAEAPGAIARWCVAANVPLLHYSTDYVFDGNASRPYREDDATAPLGVYGASKRAGEQAIVAAAGRHVILRTAWVYAAHSANFLRTMLRVGAERDVVRVVADQWGTPTPASLIAEVSARMLRQDMVRTGIYHLTATGQTSWHGFAEAIFAEAVARGVLPRAPRVDPITTAEYPTAARRPAYSCLDVTRLQSEAGVVLPSWQEGLAAVMDTLSTR